MKSKSGFTIVELLIVIVVIAVLAAITIVAYNGIQERARASSVASALNQANKKLALYQVDNPNQYPSDLSSIGVTDGNNITYQYTVNNSTNPPTYCVTATTGPTSYKASSTATTPTSGGCAGHGQGGQAAITNLAINPSASSNWTYWSTNSGNASVTRDAAATRPGSLTTGSVRTTFTVAGTVSTQLWDGSTVPLVSVAPGESVTISAWVKSSVAGRTMNIQHRWRDSANIQVTQVGGPLATLSGNWEQLTFNATAPAGAAYDHVSFFFNGQATDTWWVDDVMVTKGTTAHNYADGASPNWVWNGTAGNSSSTGPAL